SVAPASASGSCPGGNPAISLPSSSAPIRVGTNGAEAGMVKTRGSAMPDHTRVQNHWRALTEKRARAGQADTLAPVNRRRLERHAFSWNRHLVVVDWRRMIFSENRYPLFGIMR